MRFMFCRSARRGATPCPTDGLLADLPATWFR